MGQANAERRGVIYSYYPSALRRLVLEGVTTIQEMQRISAGDISIYEELTPSGGPV